MTGARLSWRALAATWGGAVMLVMRQFGVPTPSGAEREARIVRVAEAGDLLVDSERTPDGRILTLPVDLDWQRRGDRAGARFAAN